MLRLTPTEFQFVVQNECCRLSTSYQDKPHVVPVSYIYENKLFYISTDYNTKKFFNIKNNPYVSLVIDIYKPNQNRGFVIFGSVNIIENGVLFHHIYSLFFKKFTWVRKEPWKEGEAPFLEIQPYSKSSWGID